MEQITAAVGGGPQKTKAEYGLGRMFPSLESSLRPVGDIDRRRDAKN